MLPENKSGASALLVREDFLFVGTELHVQLFPVLNDEHVRALRRLKRGPSAGQSLSRGTGREHSPSHSPQPMHRGSQVPSRSALIRSVCLSH